MSKCGYMFVNMINFRRKWTTYKRYHNIILDRNLQSEIIYDLTHTPWNTWYCSGIADLNYFPVTIEI